MELKHKLEKIFNNDYPGTDRFIADVIEPIFGNEIEYIGDDLAEREKYAEKAKNAGIKHIKYIGNLTEKNYSADNIALLDVTLDDSKNIERSRVSIQQLIRSIMDYHQHLMIVFHYEDVTNNQWRFSYAYNGDSLKDSTSAKRYTYVFGKGYRGRTAAERFEVLAKSSRNNEDFEKAFSVVALSDEFFDLYRAYYAAFVEFITGKKYTDEKKLNAIISHWDWLQNDNSGQFTTTFDGNAKDVRDYIKKMFGRIVFLYFLQRKGWLYDADGNHDPRYMRHLFDGAGDLKNTFLDDVLELMFFYVLNTKPEQRVQEASLAHKDITTLPGWEKIPFLNGGLFSQDDIDPKRCVFPAIYFDKLFEFLDRYNFTIDENDQEDAEVGIDPEMLGRIFENLLEGNKDKGAFYTPKEIVDYMCRESIIAYLQNERFTDSGNEIIRKFVETYDGTSLSVEQRKYLKDKLKSVKICDPAIGSGAFPMGLVNLLSKLYSALRLSTDAAVIKRHIMEQNIYGVDIEKGAVDIARLRFWLAMIVEEKDPIPLPNLHFKIMQGNSLLESYQGVDLSDMTKVKPVTRNLFDSEDAERETLVADLKKYYETSDHTERDRLFNDIIKNVRRQLFAKNITLPQGMDPSANEEFFLWHIWFTDVFENGGFDIVIGNPPYIKEYTNRAAFNGFRETSPYYQGKMDLWYGFACHGLDLLKCNGILNFIATSNWVSSAGASKLRAKIRQDSILSHFVDFGTYMIFGDSASIQTMIMQVRKNNANTSFCTKYSRNLLSESSFYDILKLLKRQSDASSYGINTFMRNAGDAIFSFGESLIDSICKKMKNNALFLEEKMIAQGIIGAPDEAFVITDPAQFTTAEQKYIKPYYTGLKNKYRLTRTDKFIIYLSAQNFPETKFPEFKGFVSHFEPFKSKLIESKIRFKTPQKPYYYLHRERKESFFMKGSPRIITQGRALTPTFVYTEDDCYPSRALFVITSNQFNLKFLCAILNSKLIEFWLKNRGKMQGACYQIDKGPLLSIPIQYETKYVSKLISLTDEILSSDGCNLSSLIANVDYIVYHLYSLNYDDVLIVDPETPITRKQYESFNIDTYVQS